MVEDYNNLDSFSLYRLFKDNNDEKAFATIYNRFCNGLFNYLVRLIGDWHYAEDILVETFTKLANSNLDNRGSLKAWLYRVATNQAYKLLRKNRVEISLPIELTEHNTSQNEQRLSNWEVQKLLNELPEIYRSVIVLKFYGEMSYQEIADVLCIPIGTVKSRMHEGIRKLRREMGL
ncbi:MAG: RNA polymerase sigma factor [candidate division WOR-3 bacterium]